MRNKELVSGAMKEVFMQRNIAAFNAYFSDEYIEHNPLFPNGGESLKQFLQALPADFTYEPGMMTENSDFVMVHGRYSNVFGKNFIAVDIFQIKDGKLAEHWDVLQEEVPKEKSANGHNIMFPIN